MKKTWKNKIREVTVEGGIVYIQLSNGSTAIVDIEDLEVVSGTNWSATTSKSGKIYADSGRGKLHHVILPAKRGYVVDHINRNTLDCRRDNLRYVTSAQNAHNRSLASNNKVGYKGVSYAKDRGKYRAAIRVSGKLLQLGQFNSPCEAALAYNKAASEYFGEFAVLNNIVEET